MPMEVSLFTPTEEFTLHDDSSFAITPGRYRIRVMLLLSNYKRYSLKRMDTLVTLTENTLCCELYRQAVSKMRQEFPKYQVDYFTIQPAG